MQRMHESTWFIRERLQQENMTIWLKRMMDGKSGRNVYLFKNENAIKSYFCSIWILIIC